MSPLQPVTLTTRRISIVLVGLVFFALPIAGFIVGGRVNNTADLVQRINDERERNILSNCESTNMRHQATVKRLDYQLAQVELTADPARVRQLKESRKFTVALIDALVPVQDCRALADRQVTNK